MDDPSFDNESRVFARNVWTPAWGYLIDDQVAYDASGRIARGTQTGYTDATVNTYYGPMGAVIGVTGATYSETGSPVTERFDVDALGNRTYSQQLNHKPATHPDVNGDRTHTHDSYKRLTNVFATPGIGWYHNKDLTYDNAGNLNSTSIYEADQGSNTVYDASLNYYDAGDRLVVFNRAVGPFGNDETHPGQRGVFEEYRYDALGRRVAVRSRRSLNCPGTATECQQYVERTVWDGDQVILEVRAPGSNTATSAQMEADYGVYSGNQGNAMGQTAYVHAGGIDQPIVVMRTGYNGSSTPISVHPHQNWRGVFELGTKSDGTLLSYFSGSPQIAWPGAKTLVDGVVGNQGDGPIWFGGLIPGKSDGSGMQYMRNRYYDPATGKFTQQDPIGLAGGMNAYGFAGGDKVNFSDPFGLTGCDRSSESKCTLGDVARNFVAGFSAITTGDLSDKGPGWKTGAALSQVALMFGVRAPVGNVARGVDVVHFTNAEGAAAIESSGSLRAGSYVARPGQTAGRSAGAVETLLEIAPGKGAMSATFRVPADALRVPANGPVTSGGAIQSQLTRPIPLPPGSFKPTGG